MRFTIAIILLVVLVGIGGLISLDSVTNNAIKAQFVVKGSIGDESGFPLWRGSSKLYNASVAVAPDGEVLGWGPLYPNMYQVNIYDDGKTYDSFMLMIGAYDSIHPDRSRLVNCTEIKVSSFPTTRNVVLRDVKCSDFKTRIPERLQAYY